MHRADAGGQQTGAAADQGAHRAIVQHQIALGPERIGDPVFAALHAPLVGHEEGAQRFAGKEALQDIGLTARDDKAGAAPSCHGFGCHYLAAHATGAQGTAHTAGHLLDRAVHPGHGADRQGRGINPGVAGVQASHVGKTDQQVGLGKVGYQGGQGVVVAKTQLLHRHGVVLVNDRQNLPVQQGEQGVAGVEVTVAVREVVVGEQDLGHLHR